MQKSYLIKMYKTKIPKGLEINFMKVASKLINMVSLPNQISQCFEQAIVFLPVPRVESIGPNNESKKCLKFEHKFLDAKYKKQSLK